MSFERNIPKGREKTELPVKHTARGIFRRIRHIVKKKK